MSLTRRQFLLGAAALAGAPYIIGCKKTQRKIEGGLLNNSFDIGHSIRDGKSFLMPAEKIKKSVIIIGGGIAGLSAAWELDRKGFDDFLLLELEKEAGGNARSGENKVSSFPWAAHYIPVPNKSSKIELELFSELGLVRPDGSWNERHICRKPQERLFIKGEWQEGLHPLTGAVKRDEDDHRKFYELIDEMRDSGDFVIARERAGKMAELDKISMADWLKKNELNSEYLRWYVDYGCRDDYGSKIENTSAWAGVHYFACREETEDQVFTWPEGNAWVTKKLLEKLGKYVRVGEPAYKVLREKNKFIVITPKVIYEADAVVFAAPTFIAPYIFEGMPKLNHALWQYSPWIIANITIDHAPKDKRGTTLSWDNVLYNSQALGYVVANHQSGYGKGDGLVFTYYWPLCGTSPREGRKILLANDWNFWKEEILKDLEPAHPDIRELVSRIDVMRLGHAMAIPAVGTIFNEEKQRVASGSEGLFFANGDLAGFSIFEESQYHGVKAAGHALKRLGKI